MKLRTKMFLIYSIIAIIPVIVIGYYSYARWRSYITEEIRTYSANVTNSAIELSNTRLERIERDLDFITYYSDISSFSIIDVLEVFEDGPDSYTSYDILQAYRKADAVFISLMNIDTDIQGIYLITPDSVILGTSNDQSSQVNSQYDCRQDVWYQETLSLDGRYYISTAAGNGLFTDRYPSIYLARAVYEVYSHELLGVVILDLDPTVMNLDSVVTLPDFTLIYVENPETGEVLYTNVDQLRTTGIQYTDGVQSADLSLSPLRLSISFHYDTLYEQYNPALVIILMMIVIFITALLVSMHLITGRITFPLERLSRVMKHQQTNVPFINPYAGRHDEIGTLYNEYAHMLDQINEAIRRDYQNRLIVLDAQMKALEARINSHFLFNTLESINSMAELEDNQDIATMSLALGNMFRYAIKTPSELVSLQDELQHVDDYVSIQRIRFSGRFRLVKEIPRNLQDLPVLKLILQPLVENALYHGLNYCTTGDTITISAMHEPGLLRITVADNGIGISPAALIALQNSLTEESAITEIGKRTGQSIGLRNIHARIRLYYGDQFGLTIMSAAGQGTRITITIPVREETRV